MVFNKIPSTSSITTTTSEQTDNDVTTPNLANNNELNSEHGRWYIIVCKKNSEDKIKQQILEKAKNLNLKDYILDLIVIKKMHVDPHTQKAKLKNIYPGYIFGKLIFTNEIWYLIRNVPGVSGFAHSRSANTHPQPLSRQEAIEILQLHQEAQTPVTEQKKTFAIGDIVKINDDNLFGSEGKIINVNYDQNTASIEIELFGRNIPVDVKFDSLEKIRKQNG